MIYPIVAYGDTVLKKKASPVTQGELDVKKLAEDMFETMYEANGVGLAAPQIGKSIRFFVVDAEPMDEEKLVGFKKVFINATILEESGEEWAYQEGCLSIPGVREEVTRKSVIKIHYWDENWVEHTDVFDGLAARVIQHEYDHIEGVLFTDYLSPFKKRILKGKLTGISRGVARADYRMRFPAK
ncbi:peptide deformylase [Flexibacter flexilis DSM 6793]|uniref:Peptide deformylase n=1 Tax=Flexibacter flexilis DSM 6793 TaxID=927664 RepID=A0A1I1DVV5_9BACT|nr:peptide deformylase [Flexibacter flexilis]SFB78536.1 peptide deformylase [Flexibacter flexilis DSM 6793]